MFETSPAVNLETWSAFTIGGHLQFGYIFYQNFSAKGSAVVPPKNGSSVNKAISHVILVEQIYLELTPHGSVLPFLMGWVSGCSGNLPQKAFRQARLVAHQ